MTAARRRGDEMKITEEMLRAYYVCEDQVELFVATFPNGMEVTRANVNKAWSADIGVGWVAAALLSGEGWERYDKATDAAHRKYHKATDAAQEKHLDAIACAFVGAWRKHGIGLKGAPGHIGIAKCITPNRVHIVQKGRKELSTTAPPKCDRCRGYGYITSWDTNGTHHRKCGCPAGTDWTPSMGPYQDT